MASNGREQWFLVIGIAYIVVVTVYFNAIVDFMTYSNTLTRLIVYYATQPAYLLILYGMMKISSGEKALKNLVAGILLVLVVDIVSLPRIGVSNDIISEGVLTNAGFIYIQEMIRLGLSHTVAWYLYYLVTPIILLLIITGLIGSSGLAKKIRSMARL